MAVMMNQSLTPTKLDSGAPLTPSNYPDKRSMVAAYKRMVHMVLDEPEDRATLQKALKEFHGTYLVEDLVENLKDVLNHPKKRQLYLAIRPLIPSRLRQEYNSLIPHIPNFEKKVVHLKQQGSRGIGFTIRGGKEFGCGVYITSVLHSSKAAQCGLKAGDEIVRVNGLTLVAATHEEVVNLIKLKKTLTLTVKVVGMIPGQKPGSDKIVWKEVAEEKRKGSTVTRLGPIVKSTKRIQVTVDSNDVLGASIKSSSDVECGVIIVDLIPNSAAHNAGLKVGDEIVEVNGHSLVNKQHSEVVRLLKSSENLMLTIRLEESARPSSGRGWSSSTGHFDPLSNPPEDFELKPQDFDIDAELIPTDLDQSTGFVLKAKGDQAAREAIKKARAAEVSRNEKNRFSLLDMETEQSRNAPTIASPAAFGYGPALAMPTLMGMMPQFEGGEGGQAELDVSLISAPSFSPHGGMGAESRALDMSGHGARGVPPSIANIFQNVSMEEGGHTKPRPHTPPPQSPGAGDPRRNISGEDLASYQFPVDDDEEDQEGEQPPPPPRRVPHQPSSSALKKSPSESSLKGAKGVKTRKTPAFKESVEIINVQEQQIAEASMDNLQGDGTTVHPSNMEFNEEVLQGRRVAFHTIPKDGPIKIAIRGGTDTPLGGQIIISRILAGGAADRYGNLNVGDQILVCDGVGLIDVTHDEAAQALKKAMDMESNSIDLVVAVNPDFESVDDNDGGRATPKTMWPPTEEGDTICDHPPVSQQYHDFARSSHRSHSGFTLRGKDAASSAHAFLPNVPQQGLVTT